ncbi:MAG: hypothetical protein NT118_00650, partial [Lentisphaerae bacterium]|nr:hypothetical protein [Lentisphaerota bacterium]
FEYDVLGNLISYKDPVGKETTYAYDGFGNLRLVKTPDTGTDGDENSGYAVYQYNSLGQMQIKTDLNNNIKAYYCYDGMGRLAKIKKDANCGDTNNIYSTYTYDPHNGRLVSIADEAGTVIFEYDDRNGRIKTENRTFKKWS